jgi:hypothetical protein
MDCNEEWIPKSLLDYADVKEGSAWVPEFLAVDREWL